MPRSNRSRSHRRQSEVSGDLDLERARSGWRRTERRHGAMWNVQPVSAPAAVKAYRCPGCDLEIDPGTAHVVVWRADGILGDAADLKARRHWHTPCWKAG